MVILLAYGWITIGVFKEGQVAAEQLKFDSTLNQ